MLEAEHKACLGDDPKEYTNADKLLSVAQAERCDLLVRCPMSLMRIARAAS